MTPQELALYGALTGAGGYGATRLLHNAMKNVEDVITPASLNPNANLNQITLRLPKKQVPGEQPVAPLQPKMAEVTKTADPSAIINNTPAPGGGGSMEPWQYLPVAAGSLGLGYYGASKLHDFFQRRLAENQLKETQKKFQDTIGQFQQAKTAAETPLIDAYCEVMSAATEHLSKEAFDWNPLNWPADVVHGLTNIAPLNPPTGPNGADWTKSLPVPGQSTFMDEFVKPVGAGIGTLGVLKFLADKTQRMEQDDERNKAKLPQTINVVQE